MRSIWRNIIAGIIATATIYPITAFADQGVMMDTYQLKDEEGNVIRTLEKGERIQMVGATEDQYTVSMDHARYFIDKKAIMKTHIEEETFITVNEDFTPLRIMPSLFSKSVQKLSKGEVLHRTKGVMNDEYWIPVQTEKGVVGVVNRDAVTMQYKITQHSTKGFMTEEFSVDGVMFEYGQELSIVDYKEGAFVVKIGDKEYSVPESFVSNTKPSKPLVLTAPNTNPQQLKVYGNPQYIPPVNMKYPPVSSRYGMRWGKLHAGTDIAIQTGTPLYAVADGVVSVAVNNQTYSKLSWGNYVKIDHGKEDTLYGHMHQVIIQPGQRVKQGQLLGYSGNSGDSTGSHLHFELYRNGSRVDSYYIVQQPELYR